VVVPPVYGSRLPCGGVSGEGAAGTSRAGGTQRTSRGQPLAATTLSAPEPVGDPVLDDRLRKFALSGLAHNLAVISSGRLLNNACHSSRRPDHRPSLCPRPRHSRVPWPVTLVMMRGRGRGDCGKDAGRRRNWGAARTRTQPETFLAVLNAANVAGRGTGSARTSSVRLACLAADLSNGIFQQSPSAVVLTTANEAAGLLS